jgi:hypothetical protein
MEVYKSIAANSQSTSLLDQTNSPRDSVSATLAKHRMAISSFTQFTAKIVMVDLKYKDDITSFIFLGKFYIKDFQGFMCHQYPESVKLEIMDKNLLKKDAFI